MKEYALPVLLTVYANVASAECPGEQSISGLNPSIQITTKAVKAGGHHGYFDKANIKAPAIFKGLPIRSIELTEGEVANYWIPIAYEIQEDVAVLEFVGDSEAMSQFEILFVYRDSKCSLSGQYALYAYNKSPK